MKRDLTPREQQVAGLVAQGLQNSEVAKQLGLSLSTVKRHVQSAMTKLNAQNRAHLAAIYTAYRVEARASAARRAPPVAAQESAPSEVRL